MHNDKVYVSVIEETSYHAIQILSLVTFRDGYNLVSVTYNKSGTLFRAVASLLDWLQSIINNPCLIPDYLEEAQHALAPGPSLVFILAPGPVQKLSLSH